jgi:hypothetical protein
MKLISVYKKIAKSSIRRAWYYPLSGSRIPFAILKKYRTCRLVIKIINY